MTINEYFERFSSDTVAGSANQVLMPIEKRITSTGRVAYRLADGGEYYSLLYSNLIDSTYDKGQHSKCNDMGEDWQIHQLKMGLSDSLEQFPEEMTVVTFDGNSEKTVSGPEIFCTDPVLLNGRKNQYLHLEMTFSGRRFPSHVEINIDVKKKNENGEFVFNTDMPVPLMVGVDRDIKKRIGFIGDSITQGIGTPRESYLHWVAQIKEGLGKDVSVWDLGIGYSRGSDAATNGFWLERAKKCDVVNVCFGVNDINAGRTFEQITGDLETINGLLNEAGCKTVAITVPPFNFTGDARTRWEKINEYIRTVLSKKADGFFDFAKYTCDDAPNDNMAKYGGHPDIEGSTVIANAYLKDVKI